MPQMKQAADRRWTLVITTKSAAIGKSRLAPYAKDLRSDLARAMAMDTVDAALRCALVGGLIAVTDDTESARAFSSLGALVIPDEPRDGLNAALSHGAAAARLRTPDAAVAALQADLPALRPRELERALHAAARFTTAFVPDAAGIGTALYSANSGVAFQPRFGGESRRAHLESGAAELHLTGIDSVRQDVDTESDLHAAAALGLGPRSRLVLDRLLSKSA
jgi:2-phospho-L-lactate/phosphoenolpyruvate guanylyltransferase